MRLMLQTMLEPIAYHRTHLSVDQYRPDSPQAHPSGYIARALLNIDELNHTVVVGDIGQNWK